MKRLATWTKLKTNVPSGSSVDRRERCKFSQSLSLHSPLKSYGQTCHESPDKYFKTATCLSAWISIWGAVETFEDDPEANADEEAAGGSVPSGRDAARKSG